MFQRQSCPPISLHNLARIRDHRIRTKHLEPCRNLIRTMMPASNRNRVTKRTINHHDGRISPFALQKRRNHPDSDPAGHDRNNCIIPGILRKHVRKRRFRVPDHFAANKTCDALCNRMVSLKGDYCDPYRCDLLKLVGCTTSPIRIMADRSIPAVSTFSAMSATVPRMIRSSCHDAR